jgi:nitroreductase
MYSRRHFLKTAALAAGGGLLPGCASDEVGARQYAAAVRETWRHTEPMPSEVPALYRELVRYATLAPSSHNSQCWTFAPGTGVIAIKPDLSRRCPVVDPDDHHLYVSLGCAAENLAQAALANGLEAACSFDPVESAVRAQLVPTPALATPLFRAIPARQTCRSDYDGRPLPRAVLGQLEQAGRGEGVAVTLITDIPRRERLLDLALAGNAAQMEDAAFVAELKKWLRFNDYQAVVSKDGLYAPASGNPQAPSWLAGPLFSLFFRVGAENDKLARQLRSAAGVAVFHSERQEAAQWLEVGRCCERFALQATALGVRTAFVNQPVEVAGLRQRLAAELGLGTRRPDLVLRFGYGPEMPRSLRRNTGEVILKGLCM